MTGTTERAARPWSVDGEAPFATLRLDGELHAAAVRPLGNLLAELIRNGHRHVVLEMSGVADVAPICVGVLNRAFAELGQLDGTLTVRGLDQAIGQRLVGAGLHPSIQLRG